MKHLAWAVALLAVLAVAPAPARAEQQPPEHCTAMMPFGAPTLRQETTPLCRRGYFVAHDDATLTPRFVVERLDAASAWGCGSRIDAFKADPDLPAGHRAAPSDYEHSGYDLGHMANAADHLGDVQEQRETFYVSNMVPQLHALNAGLWFRLEVMVRVWAAERGDIQVISGPILAPGEKTIGRNHLPVPTGFFKVVVDVKTGETLAFLVPHAALGWKEDPARYVVSLSQVENASGVTLPRPQGWAVRQEPTQPWPVDVLRANDLRSARECQGQ